MSYVMLKYLTSRSGPTVLTDPADIEQVEFLRSLMLVEAHIPASITCRDGHIRYTGAAIVHSVTAAGRELGGRSPAISDSRSWSRPRSIHFDNDRYAMAQTQATRSSETHSAVP
jgi:hypothetical protein